MTTPNGPTSPSLPKLPPVPTRDNAHKAVGAPAPAEHPNAWMLPKPAPADADKAQDRAPATPQPTMPDFREQSAYATVGIPTSNDGRADKLDTAPFRGKRAQEVERLNGAIDDVHRQQETTREEIAKYDAVVTDKDGTASTVNRAVQLASPLLNAVDGVANLMGKNFDPVKDIVNAAEGTKDDYNQLVAKQGELAKQETTLTEQRDALVNERALNYLTNVAHVTSMKDATTDVLDGASDVKVAVTDYPADGSEARYDSATNTIEVHPSTIEAVNASLTKLQQQGVVDDDGKIIDAASFDVSKAGDEAIAMASLIGVHEATHAEQKADGTWDEAVAAGANTEAGDPATEYEAYLNMESQQLQSGRVKGGFLTVRPDGSLLPRDQAEANILAYQENPDQPLPYGQPGTTPTTPTTPAAPTTPGTGVEAPGRHGPGRHGPGRHGPGRHGPGRHGPGQSGP